MGLRAPLESTEDNRLTETSSQDMARLILDLLHVFPQHERVWTWRSWPTILKYVAMDRQIELAFYGGSDDEEHGQ
jgi:hypothetical protein